ncbi:hypothetical protein AVEN_206447-1 [Araneus ventricosus]|uniref:DUF4817 domain-containing protein n=1 Tax=Araneus ventricosus TaxID=182803 RepID=A0A4Y2NJN1_ARAVE|nr:hypothetical protein AVEN_206447-1 [Araneus ventricosus]
MKVERHTCSSETTTIKRMFLLDCPHPTRQTILKVVKRLRETGFVTSRPRVRRPRNVGRKVQPEDLLAYKMISENCGLSKRRVWTILNESGAHPHLCRDCCQEMLRDVTRGAIL